MADAALNNDELDYLDELLQSVGNDDSILDVNELDGFLTALVAGPNEVSIGEWYPAIWGGEEHVPELDSEEEAEQVEGLLLRMYGSLEAQLRDDPEAFTALFYEGEYQGETITVVEEWCFGFMRGVSLGAWPALSGEAQRWLDSVALHGDEANFPRLEQMSLDQHQDSIEAIEPAVRALYTRFHA